LKLRKGSDASVSLGQLIQVLEYLGGWQVTKIVGFVQRHGHDHPEYFTTSNENQVRLVYKEHKEKEVSILPAHPEAGVSYYMNVTEPNTNWVNQQWGFTFQRWTGENGFRFTSPEAKVLEILPGKYDRSVDPKDIRPGLHLLPWLKKETNYLEQISKVLGMPTHEEEKRQSKPRTRANTGTCGACFRNIKLKDRGKQLPVMVLHGYQRPGWGQTVGRCIGVDYPPYELSPDGTKALLQYLEGQLESQEDFLRRLKAGEVTELYHERTHKRLTPETEGAAWKMLIDSRIRKTEYTVNSLVADAKTAKKMIAEWKLAPLPEEGSEMAVWK
jgi:hypothetical protein